MSQRAREGGGLDTVSVMMRGNKRHNLTVRISECCIQWGPLTQSIVMDSTWHISTIRDLDSLSASV